MLGLANKCLLKTSVLKLEGIQERGNKKTKGFCAKLCYITHVCIHLKREDRLPIAYCPQAKNPTCNTGFRSRSWCFSHNMGYQVFMHLMTLLSQIFCILFAHHSLFVYLLHNSKLASGTTRSSPLICILERLLVPRPEKKKTKQATFTI